MSKKRVRAKHISSQQGVNWKLLGGIFGFGSVVLIALLIVTVTRPPAVAEPPPVLEGEVSTLAGYCETNPERCISIGAADAPNTVVEISDYGCSHCRDFNLTSGPVLQEQYVSTDQVHWWLLPYALSERTVPAATALLCAAEQSEDEPLMVFHETMFDLQAVGFSTEGFGSVARNSGLDGDLLEVCVDSGQYLDAVRLNQQAAAQVGVNSTPSFFVNDVLLRGNRPLSDFAFRFEN